jgi:hypothetical protein
VFISLVSFLVMAIMAPSFGGSVIKTMCSGPTSVNRAGFLQKLSCS